ncbi:MAG: uroporphyrinogen decarboxylase, partial [Verrucomicrobia bacterium]|nr:uroporphyrinogen decarboxylase [Verrucomicrobiota bacterium]
WNEVVQTGANALGIDWGIRLSDVCKEIPDTVAVQGNLDPSLLIAKPEAAIAETRKILEEMRGRNGFIFNLGHGVPPDADIDAIMAVTETVQSFK